MNLTLYVKTNGTLMKEDDVSRSLEEEEEEGENKKSGLLLFDPSSEDVDTIVRVALHRPRKEGG
jgi:hypothetical protein